jgi:hypothetical protein
MPQSEAMKDALGNDIVLGNSYGYSTADTVCFGVAEKITATKITLHVLKWKHYMYGDQIERGWRGTARTVSVFSWHLFPIPAQKKEENAS